MPIKRKTKESCGLFVEEYAGQLYPNVSEGLFYENASGRLLLGDCIDVMQSLEEGSVDMIFADPPYNIGKSRDWDCWSSMEEYIEWTERWVRAASRILKPDGTMYVCGFSEIIALCQAPAMKYFTSCKWTIWSYRNKANLTNDWGRSHEAILCFRKGKRFTFNVDDVRVPYNAHTMKYPQRTQGETSQYGGEGKQRPAWQPNPKGAKPRDVIDLPTTCNGMNEKTAHPTQKPEELVRKYVLASSNEGDLVFDPFCGSGTTAVCCEELNRKFIACDICKEYLQWAVSRLERVTHRSADYWVWLDRENTKRREGIRTATR